MTHRIVQVSALDRHEKVLKAMAEHSEVIDHWLVSHADDRLTYAYLTESEHAQTLTDALQTAIGYSEGMRILLLPVEASLPLPEKPEEPEGKHGQTVKKKGSSKAISREELVEDLTRSVRLDSTFILLVLCSTIVAAIGLLEDNVAVVIGAMVIAPLLGPNLAFALAAALGDTSLIRKSIMTNAVGVTLALLVSVGLGMLLPIPLDSHELMSRTVVGIDSIALALASGIAAVLSLTTGVSSVLVGVMVAVALLPPTTTLGLMIGAHHWPEAMGAGLLLGINIVCVNLSAKLVFLLKGISSRTWMEKRKARLTMFLSIVLLLLILVGLIYVMQHQGSGFRN